ncbi:MAG: tetratricopeptide repeat protein [Pyrinomonadaceae bacterium]|nr:tetratricopeptide repeat protein [Pyrinomonadaceae bacterium]
MTKFEQDWVQSRVSLGAAAGWNTEEMRVIADLGYKLAQQGRNDEAITIFEGLAALAPATAYFQTALGALHLRNGELQQALQYLSAALESDPADIAALTNRGETYMRLGERHAAIRDLQMVVELSSRQVFDPLSLHQVRARALLTQLL